MAASPTGPKLEASKNATVIQQLGKEPLDRSDAARWIGQVLIYVTLVCLLFNGLLINACQLILCCTIKLSSAQAWRKLHKRALGSLKYFLFAPAICVLYYWNNIDLHIDLSDYQLIEDAKRPMVGLMIPNHSYELDYMVCFALADQMRNLGCYKSISKDELKYLPVIGWCLWMSDILFVKRDWQQDKTLLNAQLDVLFDDYDQCLLGLFAEGTRWTPEKHLISEKFASERQLKPLKHHLQPRVRGFVHTVRHFQRRFKDQKATERPARPFRIFNLQIIMRERLSFGDFVRGKTIRADVYCEEVKLGPEHIEEALSGLDDDQCGQLSQLIYDIYERKDQMVEEYLANGNKFVINPDTVKANNQKQAIPGLFPYKRRTASVYAWLGHLLITSFALLGLARLDCIGALGFWSFVITGGTLCGLMLRRIDRESRTKPQPGSEMAVRASDEAPNSKRAAAMENLLELDAGASSSPAAC